MRNLKDKVIAITGGATGIGFALAKTLGSEGAKIVIGEPRKDKLKEAVSFLKIVKESLEQPKRLFLNI